MLHASSTTMTIRTLRSTTTTITTTTATATTTTTHHTTTTTTTTTATKASRTSTRPLWVMCVIGEETEHTVCRSTGYLRTLRHADAQGGTFGWEQFITATHPNPLVVSSNLNMWGWFFHTPVNANMVKLSCTIHVLSTPHPVGKVKVYGDTG